MNPTLRRIGARLLVIMLVCGALSAAAGQNPPGASPSAHSQTPRRALALRIDPKAQPVLDRAIRALGGQAFLNFKTLTTHGRIFVVSHGEDQGMLYFDSQTQYPDKRRLAYGLGKKSKPIILINNGAQGWEIDRMGAIHQDTKQTRLWAFNNRYGLENLLRLRIHEPGTLIQSAGDDFVSNLDVSVLDIVDPSQTQVKVYLSQQTGLPVEITFRRWNPTIKDWDEYADTYADYRTFQGITTPMHITRSLNGRRIVETYRNSAVYGEAYAPNLFQAPGG